MSKYTKDSQIIVTFRTPNGNIWDETHSIRMLDILKKDPTVYEIRDTEEYEIIYTKESN